MPVVTVLSCQTTSRGRPVFTETTLIVGVTDSPEIERRMFHPEQRSAVRRRCRVVTRRASRDHQRQQMLFARVRESRTRRLRPFIQPAFALDTILLHRLTQPGIERLCLCCAGSRRTQRAEVMK